MTEDAARMQKRGEKKARKLLDGVEIEPVNGITRVVFRRPRNELIVIASPEVYKTPAGTYIVYGEATIANGALPANMPTTAQGIREQMAKLQLNEVKQQQEEEEPEQELPEGIVEKDVELVMAQAAVSRSVAIRALREQNGDVINAIMDLTN